MAVITTIQLRRGTLAAWTLANPVLAAGEPGYESDTNKLKFGDGATAYLSLAYFGGAGLSTTLTSAHLYVGNAGNVATDTAITGDVTISNTGVTSVDAIDGVTVSGTTGTVNAVFSNSPTLVTPVLGVATGTSLALGGGTALATTNQTGTGSLVLATSPTLVTPALGTPSALVLTNATGLPVAGGGTGAATFTDAGVLIGNGTGAIQVTSAGTAGQVLTSNGAGVDPTFQASGGAAAGLTVIASGNLATGSPTVVDITSIPATYRALVLYITNASNSVATRALVVTVDTGLGLGNADNVAGWKQIAGTTITDGTGAAALWAPLTQTAAQFSQAYISFPAYQSGPIKKYESEVHLAEATSGNWDNTNRTMNWGVLIDSSSQPRTGAIVGIRMTWDDVSTGVFDGGTYALYGVN